MTEQASGTTADVAVSLHEAIGAIAAAAGVVDALLPRLDDEQRRLAVGLVGDLGRATDALRIRIADDITKRHDGLPKDDRFTVACGYRDPLDMLTTEFGIAHQVGKRLLEVSAALRPRVALSGGAVPARFPALGDAVMTGTVTIDQAAAIIDGLGDSPDRANPGDLEAADRALTASALGARGSHPADDGVIEQPMTPLLLAKLARRWRNGLDPDGVEPRYEEQLLRRSFTYGTRADGMLAGRFALPPDQGAVLVAAMDPFTSPRKPVFLTDEEREQAELVIDDRTRPQKMADALIAMMSTAVEQSDAPRVGGEAPTVVLHLSEATYRAALDGEPGGSATDERTGEPVPVEIAMAMMCDAHIQAVVTGADGLPLYLGRTQRLFSRAQRRALAARDKGCRAPGCSAPISWCEAHHITFWSLGGLTDIDNGIMLCIHHHHEVHRGRLQVIKGPSGWVVIPKVRAPRRRRGWAPDVDPSELYLQPAA
ncbi:DUF222 domain-containing protein [Agrococcus sp. ProA11]|uniref:HNH endonuclease signature motif containing protein n=1 Tax=Agrococcus chionoecetis TaxID=3153752 RepID=UPI003260AE27